MALHGEQTFGTGHSGGGDPGGVSFDVAYPESLSRGLIFIKWLLAIPHFLILYLMGIAFAVISIIAWFAILITGAYPRSLWQFSMTYQRWYANVASYALLMRDEYPPFAGGPYPVRLDLAYPPRLSRGLIFVKWLLVIPHLIVIAVLAWVAWFVFWIAWFAILFTGKYPRSLFGFMTGFLRWTMRANLYAGLMTDAYPPFRMGE